MTELSKTTEQVISRLEKTTDNKNGIGVGSVRTYSSSIIFAPKMLSELSSETLEIEWVWEGFIAKGHLTLFSALWKAGKSTLVSHLLKSISEGVPFVGYATQLTKVLVVSEESEGIWVRRRDDIGLSKNIAIVSKPTTQRLKNAQWAELMQLIEVYCKKEEIGLVIFDTLSTFWPVQDESSNSQIEEAMLPLNILLKDNISVMLIHHFRKSGGEHGTATRGGGALGSRADILCELSRLEGDSNSNQRIIRSIGRFDETPSELVVELTDSGYISKGTKSDATKEGKLEQLMTLFSQHEGKELTIRDLIDAWDEESLGKAPNDRSMRRYVKELLFRENIISGVDKVVGRRMTPTYKLQYGQTTPLSKGLSAVNQNTKVLADKNIINPTQELLKAKTQSLNELRFEDEEEIL